MDYWDPICSYTGISMYDYMTECRAYLEIYGDGDPKELIHYLVLQKSGTSRDEIAISVGYDDDHECTFALNRVHSIQKHEGCYSIVADVVMMQSVTVWDDYENTDGNHCEEPELELNDYYKLYIDFGREGGQWRGQGFFDDEGYGLEWFMTDEDHDTVEIWH